MYILCSIAYIYLKIDQIRMKNNILKIQTFNIEKNQTYIMDFE